MPELENREAHIALEPLLLAEKSRAHMKRLVQNREWEAEVMKDVPGWIPGTYYGTPIYHQKDIWAGVGREEYAVHSDYTKGYYNPVMERHWH